MTFGVPKDKLVLSTLTLPCVVGAGLLGTTGALALGLSRISCTFDKSSAPTTFVIVSFCSGVKFATTDGLVTAIVANVSASSCPASAKLLISPEVIASGLVAPTLLITSGEIAVAFVLAKCSNVSDVMAAGLFVASFVNVSASTTLGLAFTICVTLSPVSALAFDVTSVAMTLSSTNMGLVVAILSTVDESNWSATLFNPLALTLTSCQPSLIDAVIN